MSDVNDRDVNVSLYLFAQALNEKIYGNSESSETLTCATIYDFNSKIILIQCCRILLQNKEKRMSVYNSNSLM